jgi:hypothetical protein
MSKLLSFECSGLTRRQLSTMTNLPTSNAAYRVGGAGVGLQDTIVNAAITIITRLIVARLILS